jgi:hypothetical protein
MSETQWTFARVAAAKPELRPLARLHEALAAAAHGAAPDPRFDGTPAVHWVKGTSVLDASDREALAAPVAAAFVRVARAAGSSVEGVRAASEEILAATSRPDFAWPARIATFRDVPDETAVPHPALFRFLLLRVIASPASRLARALSPPHPDRWLRAACPWCGVPAAASIAGEGGGRTLLCVLCGGRWRRDGLDCLTCGEERSDTRLVLAARELGPASLEACATCRGGLKVFAAPDVPDGPPVALEVLTVHLDVLARAQDVSRDETALAALFPPA